jgi:hypothetical protein
MTRASRLEVDSWALVTSTFFFAAAGFGRGLKIRPRKDIRPAPSEARRAGWGEVAVELVKPAVFFVSVDGAAAPFVACSGCLSRTRRSSGLMDPMSQLAGCRADAVAGAEVTATGAAAGLDGCVVVGSGGDFLPQLNHDFLG